MQIPNLLGQLGPLVAVPTEGGRGGMAPPSSPGPLGKDTFLTKECHPYNVVSGC